MATKISPEMLKALKAVEADFDGLCALTIQDAGLLKPKGKRQDCTVGDFAEHEWCDQTSGIHEDSFHGTTTWQIGDQFLIAEFSM